jgi:hypothetical protein
MKFEVKVIGSRPPVGRGFPNGERVAPGGSAPPNGSKSRPLPLIMGMGGGA